MAKIRIKRSNEWINGTRQFCVYLDDQKVGTISKGETKDFDIPAGQYKVRAKIDWLGSNYLLCQVSENELKTLTVSNFKYGNYFIFGYVLPFSIYLLLKLFFETDLNLVATLGFCLALSVFSILTYCFAFGRDSYLQIKENQIDTE